ncbi:MAG TPA: hypothetical protein VGQ57_01800 [Polyangiaceae bacterium]|jgi:hypothetical protein|nr:hypothetical protein [Polyangiaceae bacterium]
MRLMKLFVAVPFLCFAALSGCGPHCEGLCDDAYDKDCSAPFAHGDCYKACTDAEDMNDDTDKCKDEWDNLLSCLNDLSDICDGVEIDTDGKFKKCNSARTDYGTCQAEYCAEHSKRDYCQVL